MLVEAKDRVKRKQKSKSNKKGKKQKKSPKPAEQESKESVLESFVPVYQAVIKSLPVVLWPSSSKHGQHSYTV